MARGAECIPLTESRATEAGDDVVRGNLEREVTNCDETGLVEVTNRLNGILVPAPAQLTVQDRYGRGELLGVHVQVGQDTLELGSSEVLPVDICDGSASARV
jgi:hypothetical protein